MTSYQEFLENQFQWTDAFWVEFKQSWLSAHVNCLKSPFLQVRFFKRRQALVERVIKEKKLDISKFSIFLQDHDVFFKNLIDQEKNSLQQSMKSLKVTHAYQKGSTTF